MCGIYGFITLQGFETYAKNMSKMGDAIAFRGPDGSGVWLDEKAGIGLGHNRLAIVDLSNAGAQPMHSESGRYVLVFNGEIYNHLHIRAQLKKHNWKGGSDTETLLAAIESWGLKKALNAATGMFAIALWDRQDRVINFARDRIGEKPLYYGIQNNSLIFASDLGSIRKSPGFNSVIDKEALALYFQYNAVPDPYCIYKGFRKLMAGSFISIDYENIKNNVLDEPLKYWSIHDTVGSIDDSRNLNNDTDAVLEFERLFRQSVSEQMMADVPIGAFLSGGVDSTAVVAMMQSLSDKPVKTFTIGFQEGNYNEAIHAKEVAGHLGTEHHELYLKNEQALAIVPKIQSIYSEPFADSSQIPTYLVSQLAKNNVKVALSGDGGDELFGGYGRYQMLNSELSKIYSLPFSLRLALSSAIQKISIESWDNIFNASRTFIPGAMKTYASGLRAHKFAEILKVKNSTDFYKKIVSHWDIHKLMPGIYELPSAYSEQLDSHGISPAQSMMIKDILGYLPSDILVKIDRAAMFNSLETRVPFLDYRLVEFSKKLPIHMKMRGQYTKWIVRQYVYKHVPVNLIERPKMGFGVPMAAWLRGPLKEWAYDLVMEYQKNNEDSSDHVRDIWSKLQSGEGSGLEHMIWNLAQYQAWLRSQTNG